MSTTWTYAAISHGAVMSNRPVKAVRNPNATPAKKIGTPVFTIRLDRLPIRRNVATSRAAAARKKRMSGENISVSAMNIEKM